MPGRENAIFCGRTDVGVAADSNRLRFGTKKLVSLLSSSTLRVTLSDLLIAEGVYGGVNASLADQEVMVYDRYEVLGDLDIKLDKSSTEPHCCLKGFDGVFAHL